MNADQSTYQIRDLREGHLFQRVYPSRQAANRRADRMNLEWGAHRYSVE